jgi:hypothetical protein
MNELLALARSLGAMIVESPTATVIVVQNATGASAGEFLSELEAMALTKRSKRQLADARRRGDLASFGGQRSRTYRRAELLAWVEGMKSKPVAGVDDADLERRIVRLAGSR